MTGGEKIVARILEEAEAQCEQLRREAGEQAEKLTAQAEAETKAQVAAVEEQTAKEAARAQAAARSAAQLAVRNARLACRREEIELTLTEALNTLLALPDAAYFEALTRLIQKNVRPGAGELRLNRRDRDRLPADFEKELKKQGITLSETPADIDGGFVLSYGDIEQNCAFSALLADQRDALEDLVNRELFEGDPN